MSVSFQEAILEKKQAKKVPIWRKVKMIIPWGMKAAMISGCYPLAEFLS